MNPIIVLGIEKYTAFSDLLKLLKRFFKRIVLITKIPVIIKDILTAIINNLKTLILFTSLYILAIFLKYLSFSPFFFNFHFCYWNEME